MSETKDSLIIENYLKNEVKCTETNRAFMYCLYYYNGNFFYCNDFYNSYMKCINNK